MRALVTGHARGGFSRQLSLGPGWLSPPQLLTLFFLKLLFAHGKPNLRRLLGIPAPVPSPVQDFVHLESLPRLSHGRDEDLGFLRSRWSFLFCMLLCLVCYFFCFQSVVAVFDFLHPPPFTPFPFPLRRRVALPDYSRYTVSGLIRCPPPLWVLCDPNGWEYIFG